MIARPRPARRWLFRVVAVLLGLSVFGVAEAVCVVFDWGRPTQYDDPFVGFHRVQPLFVRDRGGRNYETAKSRRQFFARDAFPVRKGPDTFRAFCLGGSTVLGHPYWKETSFTTYLRMALEAAEPDRTWEVVNCGGVSYASYRLVPILEECLAYEPDLFIICTGHNEFLEERTYGEIQRASELLAAPRRVVFRMRMFTLLRQAVLNLSGRSPGREVDPHQTLKTEVDALLDYREGLKAYHRDDEWRAGVVAHYEFNLRRMIDLAENAGIPVILVRPPSNLCDAPPFKSEHRAGLTTGEGREWQSLVDAARAAYRPDLERAVELLRQAVEIDGQHAGLWYELGKCCETLAEREPLHAAEWRRQARDAFVAARDEDICPLRILSVMEAALARVADETDTPLVDAHALLEARARGGILGGPLLVDHVHPSPELGHPLIAGALAEEIERQGFVALPAGWAERRDRLSREHYASLDTLYFLRGERRLENLEAWTKGEADGPHIDERLPAAVSDEDWRQR
ncbi:MAG TPA: hypothetical protein VML55_20735 [Planctomycetaceae bacterium]|nr:hypothetical protein [Planctomycetaceae bacterium]